MANKKKKPASKNKEQAKKKFPAKQLIAVTAALVVFLVIKTNEDNAKAALKNTVWVPHSAVNASNDEVELAEVYNTKYTTYQGSLSFDGDNRFELWLSPGVADDGTHTGTYELSENKVTAQFDDGTKTDFKVIRKDRKITGIEVEYNNYMVTFYPS